MVIIEVAIYISLFLALYFGVFIFLTFFEHRKKMYLTQPKENFPLVSLILPCYNEEENVAMVLDSLLALDYPKDKLEIVVIDDGSGDKTLSIGQEFVNKYSNVKIFHKENGGKYTALNYGLTKVQGELIGCVDADCFVEKSALRKMIGYFNDVETMAVTATIKIMRPGNILDGIQTVEYLVAAFLRKITSFWGSIIVTPGPLSVFRREVFTKIGPYRKAHFTEDLEMAFRMQTHNMKIIHCLDSCVYTRGQSTIKSLCRQRLRWQRGFLLNLKDYPHLLNFRKHGNLSLLLTYYFVGAFICLGVIGYSIFQIAHSLWKTVSNLWLVRFDLSYFWPPKAWHWSNLHLNPTFTLSLLSLAIILVFMILGKRMTLEKIKLKGKIVSYLLFYAFLNATWWVLAFYSIIFKKNLAWK